MTILYQYGYKICYNYKYNHLISCSIYIINNIGVSTSITSTSSLTFTVLDLV